MVTWFCLLYKPTMVYIAISPVISFSKRGKSKLYHVMLGLWKIAQSVALTAILRMVRIRCIGHEFPSLGDIGQKVVPMDCSPPGSSVHGIFQARVLEWVAI